MGLVERDIPDNVGEVDKAEIIMALEWKGFEIGELEGGTVGWGKAGGKARLHPEFLKGTRIKVSFDHC